MRHRLRNPAQWRRLLPAADVDRLESLYARTRQAQEAAERAYARGEYETAEDLDAEADEFAEQLENAIDALEYEPAERGEDEPDIVVRESWETIFGARRPLEAGGELSLEEQFVAEYAEFVALLKGATGIGAWWAITPANAYFHLCERLRDIASAYWSFRNDVSADELVAAARDAYDVEVARRTRKKGDRRALGNERKENPTPYEELSLTMSKLKRGDVVAVGRKQWIVMRPLGDVQAWVYQHPSKHKKLYEMRAVGRESGDVVVFQVGGTGQRVSSDLVSGRLRVTGETQMF